MSMHQPDINEMLGDSIDVSEDPKPTSYASSAPSGGTLETGRAVGSNHGAVPTRVGYKIQPTSGVSTTLSWNDQYGYGSIGAIELTTV